MNAIDRPRPQTAPASAEDWAAFLKPLLAALNQQPGREQFMARCAAIAFAVPNVPQHMLSTWRQREALARFKFLPSPAEIAEWLGPDLQAERETAARQTAIAAPAPEPRGPRPIAEVMAVRQKAAAFAAEVAARDMGRERPQVKAAPLSDGALLAHYERAAAEGNGAAAMRAEQIRARLPVTHDDA